MKEETYTIPECITILKKFGSADKLIITEKEIYFLCGDRKSECYKDKWGFKDALKFLK